MPFRGNEIDRSSEYVIKNESLAKRINVEQYCMAQSLRRETEPVDVEALLAEAERLIDQAGEGIEDPIQLNQLKTAQFTLSQIRTQLA